MMSQSLNPNSVTHLPYPYAPSIVTATFKAQVSDFIVNELLDIEFSGQGEHLWVFVEKTNLNTVFVAKLLAQWAKIPTKDVGYSGLKDRHAITTQWFSLRLPTQALPSIPFDTYTFIENKLNTDEQLQLLTSHWHTKKLQRATHHANQFIITLRDVKGDKAQIDNQLHHIKQHGVPNYFGEQRFGRNQQNLNQAIELFNEHTLNGKKPNRKYDQDKISMVLSAARSELFNAIVAKRVTLGIWDTALLGDVMNLAGSNSIFVPDAIDETIVTRLQASDIHITAALWGEGELKSFGAIAELEQAVIQDNPYYQQLAQGLIKFGLKQQRRPIRLIPTNFSWQWQADGQLQLSFDLPTGSFATTIIDSLIQDQSPS